MAMLDGNAITVCKCLTITANPMMNSQIKMNLQFTTEITEGTTSYKFTAKQLERSDWKTQKVMEE